MKKLNFFYGLFGADILIKQVTKYNQVTFQN